MIINLDRKHKNFVVNKNKNIELILGKFKYKINC